MQASRTDRMERLMPTPGGNSENWAMVQEHHAVRFLRPPGIDGLRSFNSIERSSAAGSFDNTQWTNGR